MTAFDQGRAASGAILKYAAALAALSLLYFASARFGLRWAVVQENVTAIWPPSGIALAVLLRYGRRLWPGIFVGAFLANLGTSAAPMTAAGIALGNTLEVVAGAALLSFTGFDSRLQRLDDVLRLIGLAAALAPAIAATNGAVQICLGGLAPWSDFWPIWLAWWLGDGLSVVVLTPVLLTWTTLVPACPRVRTVIEASTIGIVLVGASMLSFRGVGVEAGHPAVAYAAFPAVLIAAARFGPRGASLSVLLATILAIWAGVRGLGTLAGSTPSDYTAVLQVFAASLAGSGLALAAALAERETALAALKRSEADATGARARLTDAIESLSDHFFLYDADDRLIMSNHVARDWHPDFAAAVVPGAHFTDLIRAAARTGLMESGGASIEEIVRQRMAFHRKNYGATLEQHVAGRWLQVREFPTRDGGVVVLRTDITTLKQHEAALIEARNQLRDSIEALSEGFALYDVEDRLVLCNSKYKEFYARSADLLVAGARFEDIIREGARRGQYPAAAGRVEEYVAERMAAHRTSAGAVEQELGDGRWLRIAERRTRDGGTAGIRTDITELKQAMAALRDSEREASRARALLVDAIESLSDGFVLWDAQDRLVLCNQAIRRMVPEQSDLLIPGVSYSQAIEQRIHKGDIIEAIGREDSFIRERIAQHRLATGEAIEQHLSNGLWTRVRERRTSEGGIVSVRTDITTLKQREAELIAARAEAIRANRAKSEFLAMMSHELRTPLNVVIGFAEILRAQGGRLDAVKITDYANDVYEAARHLLNLLNDVLDLSKAEAGKMELQLSTVDVADVVHRALRMIKERAVHGRVQLADQIEPALPFLMADERKLLQILLNLLSNAVKFTPENGLVTITAGQEEDWLTVRVIDTGIGIAPENIDKAMTAFGQVGNLLTREQPGTGLGLPLAKRLTELHGATLSLESRVGTGTTVTLRFPLTVAKAAATG